MVLCKNVFLCDKETLFNEGFIIMQQTAFKQCPSLSMGRRWMNLVFRVEK